MKIKLIALAVALMFVLTARSSEADSSKSYVKYVKDRTVLVIRACGKKSENGLGSAYGTGVKVSSNKVYTAYHLLEKGKGCDFLVDGKKAKGLHYSKGRDIAALSYKSKATPIKVRNPVLGEKIICSGYSRMYFKTKPLLSITYGSITTVGLPGGLVRIDNNINQGHSGGGCYSQRDGALLGIVVSLHTDPDDAPITGYSYLKPLI
jgi:hypothetical protein